MAQKISRRSFCTAAICSLAPLAALSGNMRTTPPQKNLSENKNTAGKDSKLKKNLVKKIFPPSRAGIDRFEELCTGCMACVGACDGFVIKPNKTISGVEMDFKSGYCIYTCTSCMDACPTGALMPVSKQEKLTLKIGLAVLEETLCLNVKNSDGMCAICAEACPAAALEMAPLPGNSDTTIPDIAPNLCVGCGACANMCPSSAIKIVAVER